VRTATVGGLLGLALIVDQSSQLPLAQSLYAGARSDMRTFAEFLPLVRQRLRALTGQPEQLTLVFDAGASSRQNLQGLAGYVTALPPSRHMALLAEAVDQLTTVALSTGAVVQAWRTHRLIAGEQREIVVVHSPKLHAGQVRGLGQTMARATTAIQELDSDCARLSLEAVQQRMKKICDRQYLRKLLQYEVTADEVGGSRLRVWCNGEEYQRLDRRYFGLRVLISDRTEWSTGEIVAAYRGQSRVAIQFIDQIDPAFAFRDLRQVVGDGFAIGFGDIWIGGVGFDEEDRLTRKKSARRAVSGPSRWAAIFQVSQSRRTANNGFTNRPRPNFSGMASTAGHPGTYRTNHFPSRWTVCTKNRFCGCC